MVWPLLAQGAGERTMLILGDSLSAAYGMEVQESWPSLLQQRFDEDGYDWRVFNSSIAGDTTQGGLTRLPRLLENQAPTVVLIELGGNDGLRGLPLDVTRGNLQQMIDLSVEVLQDVAGQDLSARGEQAIHLAGYLGDLTGTRTC